MIVPFVFTLEVYSDYDHLIPFYKYLDMAKRYRWPMIAHERYFRDFDEMDHLGIGEQWFQMVGQIYAFEPLTQQDLDSIPQYKIPESFEKDLIAQFPTQMDAWVFLLRNEHPPFTRLIEDMLDDMVEKMQQPVEAFICYYSPASLKAVALKRNIPILHQQGGAIRQPAYRELYVYLDQKNMYDYGELEERYQRFCVECRQRPVPMLSRKGLLKMFLAPQYQRDLHLIDRSPSYEIGLLLASGLSGAGLQFNLMTNEELRLRASRRFAPEEILERERPGFVLRGTDDSPTSFHFACKCRRVAARASSGLFEAMLVGRTACVYGHSCYSFMADRGVEEGKDSIAPLDFLNFVIFGYYLPVAWMTDVNYLRFRLSNPSEAEIYMRGYEHAVRSIAPENLQFYSAGRPYEYTLGAPLYFTKAGDYSALLYFDSGLSEPEEEFIWSSGDETTAKFCVGTMNQDLCLRFDIAGVYMQNRTEQLVSLFVNDSYMSTIPLKADARQFSFNISKEVCQTETLCICLRYASPQAPPVDGRQLTVAYQRAVLEGIPRPPQQLAVESKS